AGIGSMSYVGITEFLHCASAARRCCGCTTSHSSAPATPASAMPMSAPDHEPVHRTRYAVRIGPTTPAALPQKLVQPDTMPVAAPPRSCVAGQIETCVTPTAPSDTHSSAIIGTICGVNAATMSATALTTKPAIAKGTRALHTEPLRR